ncbi:MAG: hypothetical protein A2293_02345 [Elusimicrobia bacterium RIFOXYB2_FULL_49_7]|nr:MAG: hypothetical protein A2293_02345 [Elusimicrobia bacterium RIFOXYB2_FULL_49_7]
MTPQLLSIVILFLLAVIFLYVFLKTRRPDNALFLLQQQLESLKIKLEEESSERNRLFSDSVLRLQESLGLNMRNVTDGINTRLGENKDVINGTNKRLDDAAKFMMELQKRLAVLGEKTDSLSTIGKDISRLSDIFQSPKLRGNLGELILERILEQMLPRELYTLQHAFADNSKVDAVIKLADKLVPVDAKFPLENFRRFYDSSLTDEQKARFKKEFSSDVKKHLDKIADKYIKPGEGTFDFALMYIPSETIYYEIITQDEQIPEGNTLLDHARKRKVIPVSPNSFYAYLQVIVFGLRGMEIEKNAVELQERLKRIQADFALFFDHFSNIGTKIDLLRKEYDQAGKRFELMDRRMSKITGSESVSDGPDKEENPV